MNIKNLDLAGKRVFLRADLNVPLQNKKILNSYKLESIKPTIDYIQSHGGKVILATHIGRPNALSRTNFFDENLSTKLLVPWFEQADYEIEYEIDLKQAVKKSRQDFGKILLLENLRFFNGEQQTSIQFAKLLAQCADVYVNDAFGVMHRNDTSVTLLPKQFKPENRARGLLVEKEIETLTKLKTSPTQPFIVVLGGNKIETKMPLLESLLKQPKESRVRSILIGGAIAKSIDKDFLEKAKKSKVKVLLPEDYLKINDSIIDIGPKTIERFKKEIAQAKTIFTNGPMGIYEKEEGETGSREILQTIAQSSAYSVVGGGDAVAATFRFGLENKMGFLSTGGGSTLAFLAN